MVGGEAGPRALLIEPREDGVVASGYAALASFGSAREYRRLDGTVRAIKSWGAHALSAP